ncbi:hypothetical protein RvY_15895 [Ramazzottius varieornatus]|uniref:Histone-lysine N-methyltransferase n=1 Tax=Ramazzottius varieornatus TaxID=947166 RepID=A0A1D1VZK6_RAMVA|nr:hypothetical protein RvY_15895 [Ramazzottius varieornatus]
MTHLADSAVDPDRKSDQDAALNEIQTTPLTPGSPESDTASVLERNMMEELIAMGDEAEDATAAGPEPPAIPDDALEKMDSEEVAPDAGAEADTKVVLEKVEIEEATPDPHLDAVSEVVQKKVEAGAVTDPEAVAKEVLEKILVSTVQRVHPVKLSQAIPVKVSAENVTRLDKLLTGSGAAGSTDTQPEVEKETTSLLLIGEVTVVAEVVLTEVPTETTTVAENIVSSAVSTEVTVPAVSLASTRESSCNSSLGCEVSNSNSGTVSSENSNITDDEDDDYLTTTQKLIIDEGGLDSRNTSFVKSRCNTPEGSSAGKTKKRSAPDTPFPSPLSKSKKTSSSTNVKKGGSEVKTDGLEKASGKKGSKDFGTFEIGKYPIDRLVKDAFLVEAEYHPVCAHCMNHKHLEDATKLPIRCKGKCGMNYHIECLKDNANEYPDVEKDYDPENFVCAECAAGEHFCFDCLQSEKDSKLVRCPDAGCGRFFHYKCLMGTEPPATVQPEVALPVVADPPVLEVPAVVDPAVVNPLVVGPAVVGVPSVLAPAVIDSIAVNLPVPVPAAVKSVAANPAPVGPRAVSKKKSALRPCRQHHCGTCKALGRSGKSKEVDKSLVKCMFCPVAYHFNFMCFPAEAFICAENARYMICPRHRNVKVIEEQSKRSKSTKAGVPNKSIRPTAMNNTVCMSCKSPGELLVCETCPFTSHVDCAGLDDMPPWDVPWHCPDCSKGKLPMVLDIVWFKSGAHRCWPCQILPSNICPKNVQSRAPEGTFIMRYLGTTDYGFATSSEVLPFEIMDRRWVQHPEKTRQFAAGLAEARKFTIELNVQRNNYLPKWFEGVRPNYVRIKGNKAVPPARYGRKESKNGDEDSICNCKPTDRFPCGPNSGCLNRDMEYECPKSCPTGKSCMNQRLRNRKYPKLKVFYTADRGWALLSQVDITKGDLVVEYVGEIITTQERDRRISTMRVAGDVNFYFLDLTEGRVIDAGPAGNLARFANHSCDANCSSEKWIVDGETRIALMAIKDIKKGDEITFDYRWQYEANVTSRECLCGSEKCNGTIGGKTYVAKQGPEKKTPAEKKKPAPKKPVRKSTPRPKKTPTSSKKPVLQEQSDSGSVTEEDMQLKMDVDMEEDKTSAAHSPPIVPSETSEISV